MKITDVRHYWLSHFIYDGNDHPYTRGRTVEQSTAEPTTPDEIAALSEGFCPLCGDALEGDSGRFCVRDQTEWKMVRADG